MQGASPPPSCQTPWWAGSKKHADRYWGRGTLLRCDDQVVHVHRKVLLYRRLLNSSLSWQRAVLSGERCPLQMHVCLGPLRRIHKDRVGATWGEKCAGWSLSTGGIFNQIVYLLSWNALWTVTIIQGHIYLITYLIHVNLTHYTVHGRHRDGCRDESGSFSLKQLRVSPRIWWWKLKVQKQNKQQQKNQTYKQGTSATKELWKFRRRKHSIQLVGIHVFKKLILGGSLVG